MGNGQYENRKGFTIYKRNELTRKSTVKLSRKSILSRTGFELSFILCYLNPQLCSHHIDK